MKRLWYGSKGLGLEYVGLRDLWRGQVSLRISPTLEPEQLPSEGKHLTQS